MIFKLMPIGFFLAALALFALSAVFVDTDPNSAHANAATAYLQAGVIVLLMAFGALGIISLTDED